MGLPILSFEAGSVKMDETGARMGLDLSLVLAFMKNQSVSLLRSK